MGTTAHKTSCGLFFFIAQVFLRLSKYHVYLLEEITSEF